jgi:hypothetical protein
MVEKFPDFYARLREYQVRTWTAHQNGMLPTEAAALEAVVMETWLDDEIKCESGHRDRRNPVCSGDVVARLVCPCGDVVGCSNAAAFWTWAATSLDICNDCDLPIRDHWKVVPI